MSIKTLVFVLLLYIALIWIAAIGLHSGDAVRGFGLFWTAAGIAVVLAGIVLSVAYGQWRVYRAGVQRRPPAPPAPARKSDPEEAAIASLIRTANAALAKIAKSGAAPAGADIHNLPLYILTGPEGSGKTSLLANAGVECELLAGRLTDPRRPEKTEYMNIWYSGGAVFAEISGQAFAAGPGASEPGAWTRILTALHGADSRPPWRRVFEGERARPGLRGVISVVGAKELIGAAADSQRFERLCRLCKERLASISAVFGAPAPVYQIFTGCDSISFFREFFRRLPEGETGQVFGCALGADDSRGADALAKTLTDSFRDLCRGIAGRRIFHLAQEPDTASRPAIFEFPRELKRIRSPLVQFLAEAVYSGSLAPATLLRGYYLTGLADTVPAGDPVAAAPERSSSGTGATRFFRGDATRMFRPEDSAFQARPAPGARRAAWLFTRDIFLRVLPADRPPLPAHAARDERVERSRTLIAVIAASLCFALCLALTISWIANRDLLKRIADAADRAAPSAAENGSLRALRSLDQLRAEMRNLRQGPGIGMRFGLYAGDRVLDPLRQAYFSRFRRLLLVPANARMVDALEAPDTTGAESLYRILKTHLMIAGGACEADPPLISAVLKQQSRPPADEADAARWSSLAGEQIDFYAGELRYGNPCSLSPDTVACGRARDALRNMRGVSRYYDGLLADAAKNATPPRRLSDVAPHWSDVLRGPADVSPAFTPQGRDIVFRGAKDFHVSSADACALGNSSSASGGAGELQTLYVRGYIEAWRKYLQSFEIARYRDAHDAAAKLAVLADHGSPLLGLFAVTAAATDFKPSAASSAIDRGSRYLGKVFGDSGAQAAAENARRAADGDLRQISRTFQPVRQVVDPASDTWVSSRNAPYLDALGKLGESMQKLADSRGAIDDAVFREANTNYDAALEAARQIERGFEPADAQGVDAIAKRLLEEPLQMAKAFIVDPREDARKHIDAQYQAVCRSVSPLLRKYPFRSSGADSSLAEFSAAFAPASGAIWKFAAESMPDLIVRDAGGWKAKDAAAKPGPSGSLIAFLNRAQTITNAFFPAGSASPRFAYSLRPKLDSSVAGTIQVELDVDGQKHRWTNSFQAPFTWPAAAGAKPGAVARIWAGSFDTGFAGREGLWGIFRIVGDAEPRALNAPVIEWKYTRGRDGELIPMSKPVALEIAEFPGGTYDVFNSKFYEGLQCAGPPLE